MAWPLCKTSAAPDTSDVASADAMVSNVRSCTLYRYQCVSLLPKLNVKRNGCSSAPVRACQSTCDRCPLVAPTAQRRQSCSRTMDGAVPAVQSTNAETSASCMPGHELVACAVYKAAERAPAAPACAHRPAHRDLSSIVFVRL